jgi:predicted DNA-binding protein (MmcQ/YjbR family)
MGNAMKADELKSYCLELLGAREDFPFGAETSVFKVAGKMFALSHLAGDPLQISLKCDPDFAEHLRQTYPAVIPGYHLAKRHWNTITIDGSISDEMLRDLIRDSYDLVVAKLPKLQRANLGNPAS